MVGGLSADGEAGGVPVVGVGPGDGDGVNMSVSKYAISHCSKSRDAMAL